MIALAFVVCLAGAVWVTAVLARHAGYLRGYIEGARTRPPRPRTGLSRCRPHRTGYAVGWPVYDYETETTHQGDAQ